MSKSGRGDVDAVTAERDGMRWFLRVAELLGVFSQARWITRRNGSRPIAAFLDVRSDRFDVVV